LPGRHQLGERNEFIFEDVAVHLVQAACSPTPSVELESIQPPNR
jgi:hypothetical protein